MNTENTFNILKIKEKFEKNPYNWIILAKYEGQKRKDNWDMEYHSLDYFEDYEDFPENLLIKLIDIKNEDILNKVLDRNTYIEIIETTVDNETFKFNKNQFLDNYNEKNNYKLEFNPNNWEDEEDFF